MCISHSQTQRLFIALEFDEEAKERMLVVARRLADECGGRAVKRPHVHLTLAFLGEVSPKEAERARRVVQRVCLPELPLSFRSVGCFHRGSDLFFLEPERESALFTLRNEITSGLQAEKLPFDSKSFRPHVTLLRDAREGRTPDMGAYSDLLPFEARGIAVTLFRSERRADGLAHIKLEVKGRLDG